MMTPVELHQHFQIALMRPRADASAVYHGTLLSTAAALGEETIEASAAWFDYASDETGSDVESAIHLRIVTQGGVITTDCELSFDGLPDARFIGWSRVIAVRVVATGTSEVSAVGVWLETELGKIEFAGAKRPQVDAILKAVRRHLK
ncbi:UNVERIFIED_CONTAM: hypothetical protein OHV15_07970 [Microbacterium sp. SLM126]